MCAVCLHTPVLAESAAEKYEKWSSVPIRDDEPPPGPPPEVLRALAARQEHYMFLAQAMARYGGDSCSPNLPLYISPARLGHLSARWCGEGGALFHAARGTSILL